MYLDDRSFSILKEVLANPVISNSQLEKKLNLSRSQLNYSFQKINDYLETNHYPVIKRTKQGTFQISPVLVDIFFKHVEETTAGYIPSEEERAKFILLMILNQSEELSLIHFTSALDVSKNTILRDLKYAQTIIASFDIEMGYSRMQGYEMKGAEWEKRKLLLQLLDEVLRIYECEWYLQKILSLTQAEVERMGYLLEKVETGLQVTFSDERFKLLQYFLVILFRRIKQGKYINDYYYIDYGSLSDTKEYQAAEILIREISPVPEEEHLFITLQLLTADVLSGSFIANDELPQLRQAIQKTLTIFERKAKLQLKDKESLLHQLMLHMKPAYYRIKYELTVNDLNVEKVRKEFHKIHSILMDSLNPLENFLTCPIPENEIAFITILIDGHLLNSGDTIQIKKKAVVVCQKGVSVMNHIQNSLQDLFPEFYFYNGRSVREFHESQMNIDIVFSQVPLQTPHQLFIVHSLMTEYEKIQLRQRVMKEVFGYHTNTIHIEQLISIIDKYTVIQDQNGLEKDLKEYFSVQLTSENKKNQ